MQLISLVLCGFVAVLCCTVAQAEELQRMTLPEAITKGLKQNNSVRAARFQADAARSGADAASLHFLPSIYFEESWTRSNVPVNTFMMKLNQGRFSNQDFDAQKLNNPSATADFRTALTIEQPLLSPAAWAGGKAARHGAERQETAAEQMRQQTAYQIFQYYLETQKAHAYLQASEKALEEARESRRLAAVRTAAGMGLKSDELRAQTHLATVEQQRIGAENNLTLVRMQLALATGGQPGEQVDSAAEFQFKAAPKQLNTLTALAQQERHDLQGLYRGREQADALVLEANAKFLPTVGAIGTWQMNDSTSPFGKDHDSWMVGVSLKWNIFDGLRTLRTGDQARSARAAANEQLEQARKEISLQVHDAWLRRIEAEKRREVARTALASAEEAVRLIGKRFENALATMVELLDAQSALNQSRANLVESDAGLKLATGRLYYVAGIFLKEVQ